MSNSGTCPKCGQHAIGGGLCGRCFSAALATYKEYRALFVDSAVAKAAECLTKTCGECKHFWQGFCLNGSVWLDLQKNVPNITEADDE